MATKAQKVKLGIFLVGGGVLSVVVIALFAGAAFWESVNRYYVLVPESVHGLEIGSSVLLRGVEVGRVDEMTLAPDKDYDSVRVALNVSEDVVVSEDCYASLVFRGVTGLKVVNILGGSRESPRLEPGSFIEYRESGVDRITNQAQALIEQASALMASTNQLVGNLAAASRELNLERVDSVLRHMEGMAANLQAASGELDAMVSENRKPIGNLLLSAQASFERVDDLASEAEQALETLGTLVANVGGMVRANDDQLRATMLNLRETSQNFRHLSRELRKRPSQLLFSRPPEERELP